MRQEQNGRLRARPAISDDEVFIAWPGADDLNLSIGEARFAKTSRQQFCRFGRISRRMRGVGLDQLLVDLAPKLLVGRQFRGSKPGTVKTGDGHDYQA